MRRAAGYRCVFLGRTAEHLHHSAGRDADGQYIYPRLVMPVVCSQHGVLHKAWNIDEIGEESDRPRLALAHYRISHDLDLLGRFHDDGIVPLPASFVVDLGRVHRHVAEQFEAMG